MLSGVTPVAPRLVTSFFEDSIVGIHDTVREHFLKPRNAGELADANAIGEVGSLACGDALKLFLKINDKGIIEDASSRRSLCQRYFVSSALTEMIKGKTWKKRHR